MKKFEYVIEVRDSSNTVAELHVQAGRITERNLETLVRVLVVKYGKLEDHEVVASLLKRNARGYRSLLEINKHATAPKFGWMCCAGVKVLVTGGPVEVDTVRARRSRQPPPSDGR